MHPNIVPFLGFTNEPIHIVSAWMPGIKLNTYIANHPDINRVDLVGLSPLTFRVIFTPFQVNWHRQRPQLPPLP